MRINPTSTVSTFSSIWPPSQLKYVSQELSLLQYFEPEVNLAGHPRIWGAAQKLRDALRQAQEREAVAEHEWKKQWNMPRMGMPSSGWV